MITEDHLEQLCLDWFRTGGYATKRCAGSDHDKCSKLFRNIVKIGQIPGLKRAFHGQNRPAKRSLSGYGGGRFIKRGDYWV
jgi:hypothetical protein